MLNVSIHLLHLVKVSAGLETEKKQKKTVDLLNFLQSDL